MWKWIAALLLVVPIAGVCGVELRAAFAQDKPTLSQPVMETERFMKKFTDPLMENLHEALAVEPASPRDWRSLEDEAASGAEIANLVAIRNDEDAQHAEWQDMTKVMYDAAVTLSESAKVRDYATSQTNYQALVESCNACHQKIDPETLPVIEP
jgi:cytochrome c556